MPTGIYKRKPRSEEHKAKLRIAMLGNTNTIGKTWKIKDTSKMKGHQHGFKKGQTSWNKGKKGLQSHSIETKLKISEALKGEKSHNWIVDRTKLKTGREKCYDTKYKYWMLEVKNRDNWVCRIADVNCDGRLEAHHILNWTDYPELRYEINNGITLCHAHHPRGREREAEFLPYFQQLVGERK